MNWKFWKREEQVLPEAMAENITPVIKDKSTSPTIADYPRSEYTAYWEVMLKGNTGILNFYPYKGQGLLATHVYEGTSEKEVREKIQRAIRSKMDQYRKQ